MALREVGKYKILRELGRGAMGAVYLAEDPHIGRQVAIKVMRPQVEEGSERFLHEARTVGSLSHPNIVLLHDFGFVGELPYLVMEHVEGMILDRWLTEPHDTRDRLRILAGLCRAVAYAHSRGVLHRDLKPSNVLVRSDGEAKLLDFGIALVEDTRMTATGVVLGTPEYLAPELLGSGKFSPQSDLYALGLVAYELFGGRNPFAADTLAACLRRVLEVEPAPLPADSAAPAEVVAELMCCLAKDPQRRPTSPERLLAATERALAGGLAPAARLPLASSPTTRMATAAQGVRPARLRWWIAAGALLAAGLAAGYWWLGPVGTPPAAVPGGRVPAEATLRPDSPPGSTAPPDQPPVSPAASVPATTAVTAAAREAIAEPATQPATEPVAVTAAPPLRRTSPAPRRVAPPPAATAKGSPAESSPPPTVSLVPADPRLPVPVPAPDTAQPTHPPAAVVPVAPPSTAPPAPVAARPAPPRLTALSPSTLRRGAGVTVRLHGERLSDGWSVQFRRGGKVTDQIRVLRAKRIGPGELELSLLPDVDAPIGTYGLVLVTGAGESTNSISFEVDL